MVDQCFESLDRHRRVESAVQQQHRATVVGGYAVFFNVPLLFEDFDQFDRCVINVTHSDHQLSPELYQEVKDEFTLKMQPDGVKFLLPIRVDLLRKPNQERTRR